MLERLGLARTLEPFGHEPDRVESFALDHHQRLLGAGNVEGLQQLAVVEHEVVVSTAGVGSETMR